MGKSHDQKIGGHGVSNSKFADSMLWFGLGIAFFFWVFSALLRFLNSPSTPWQNLLLGSEFEIYEKMIVICLFIIFGSHVQENIKRRQKAEEHLRESEEKYRTILESIEEGYYEVDLQGHLSFFNPSLARTLCYTKKELLDKPITSYIADKDSEAINTVFQKVMANQTPAQTVECEFQIKGGGRKIIEMSVSLIKDTNHKAAGYRGIIRDITEKRLLERNLLQSLKDVKEARSGIILGLAKLAEYRDSDTGAHLERIREFSKIIANELSKLSKYQDYITPDYIQDIYNSSILHDIGKVGVPDAILLKKGKLNDEEFAIIKQHSLLGGKALSAVDAQFSGQSFLTIGKEIAYYHHERWNGKGYPNGLKENQIPLSARIVSLADVYDALTSKRCYKDAYSHEEAKKIIMEEKGKMFDPEVVDAFMTHEDLFRQIREKMRE